MPWFAILAAITLLFAAGYGLHRLALWAERRGWIYYKHHKAPPGASAMALMELDRIWKPEIEHVVDEMWGGEYRTVVDEEDEGD